MALRSLPWILNRNPEDEARALKVINVPLADNDENAEDWVQGPAVCLGCNHKFVSVMQVASSTANALECPRCHSRKAILQDFIFFQNAPVWHCARCQGFLLSIAVHNAGAQAVCANCGNMAPLIEAFDAAQGTT